MELLERDEALATLHRAREDAAAGTGRVALVTGEPGIGKTALTARFAREAEARARVLVGTCDDLSIPRPLGPLHDIAPGLGPQAAAALEPGAGAGGVHGAVVADLAHGRRPAVLVVEDVHWADDATLDFITVLGRRVHGLPVLLVLTYRDGEVPHGHPLRAALAAIRPEARVHVELEPLSREAVAALAGEEADDVHAATGGNAFFVTELLAARPADLPASVAVAVLGRAARLGEEERHLLELVSVVPNRVSTALLDVLVPDWAAAAEEPERRRLIEVDPGHVRFRHELARHAIRSSISAAALRRLHATVLEVLLVQGADAADVVHHAEAAGAEEVVATHALVAARSAAAVGSNRQAYSHYRRAAELAHHHPVARQAAIFEELASAAYAAGHLAEAFPAIENATALHAYDRDMEAVGRCTRIRSRLHWFAGQSELARRAAHDAIAILEPVGATVELARAYSGLSQLHMLADEGEEAIDWGGRALELAERLRDDRVRAHAMINIGSVHVARNASDSALLLEGAELAAAVGEHHDTVRALTNLAFTLIMWVEPEEALAVCERGLEHARRHEVDSLAPYFVAMIAWLRVRAGDWVAADVLESDRTGSITELLARTVLAERAVRRGDDDAAERLAEVSATAEHAGDPSRLTPVLELAVEWALTSGAPVPEQRLRDLLGEHPQPGRFTVRLAAFAAAAGLDVALDQDEPAAYAAMVRRDWATAAGAFGAAGWRYDRALALSLLDDAEALGEALDLARALSAGPLATRVTHRMRDLGLRVPPGPRTPTRANPAGLTPRQLEVLALLAEDLTNAEIAERLVLSQRTAEHHVAAVMGKLGAATRQEAARRAAELGVRPRGTRGDGGAVTAPSGATTVGP